jgi:hypothetical protein
MLKMNEQERATLKALANKHKDFLAVDEALLEQPLRSIVLFVKEAIDWEP